MNWNWNRVEEIEVSDFSSQSVVLHSSPIKSFQKDRDQPDEDEHFSKLCHSLPVTFTVVEIMYETIEFVACRIVFEERDGEILEATSSDLALVKKCVEVGVGMKITAQSVFKWKVSGVLNCWCIEDPSIFQ